MSLASQINTAFGQVGTDVGQLRNWINGATADLTALSTLNKSNLVAAINELYSAIGNAVQIQDGITSAASVWSSNKVQTEISAAIAGLIDGAPGALDTLNELAAALNDDAGQITSILSALDNRVRFDADQTLTSTQKARACNNIGVGDPTTNFLTAYTSNRDV